MKQKIISLICIIAFSVSINAQTEKFLAGGISFEGPKGWQSQKPSSSMRKAQFVIKDKNGTAEVVFFHFGPGAAGGVKANVDRWLGQFKEPIDQVKAKISDEKVNGIKVTYVTAEGTFMKGSPFGGKKVAAPNSGLLAAIIEGKQGAVFIKATGPKVITYSAKKTMKQMVEKALKK